MNTRQTKAMTASILFVLPYPCGNMARPQRDNQPQSQRQGNYLLIALAPYPDEHRHADGERNGIDSLNTRL